MTDFASSYVLSDTVLEAYIGSDPRTEAIALKAAAAATQLWYSQRATRIIDMISFQGYKLTSSQARQFPRKYSPSYPPSQSPWGSIITEDAYGYIYTSTSVPQDVIDACCEEAIALYNFYSSTANQSRQIRQDQGITSFSLGDLSESYSVATKKNNYNLKSIDAVKLLEKYIENSVCQV